MNDQFKPTRKEVRSVKDLAKWCEEEAGTDNTIAGRPSSEVWSKCAFGIANDVAKRSKP